MGRFNIEPSFFVDILKKFTIAKTANDKVMDVLTFHFTDKGVKVEQTDDSVTSAVIGLLSSSKFNTYSPGKRPLTFEVEDILKDIPRVFKKLMSIEFRWSDSEDDNMIYVSGGNIELSFECRYADEKKLNADVNIVNSVPIIGNEIIAQFYVNSKEIREVLSLFQLSSVDYVCIECEGTSANISVSGKKKKLKRTLKIEPGTEERVKVEIPAKYMYLSASSLDGDVLVTISNTMFVTVGELTSDYRVYHIFAPKVID